MPKVISDNTKSVPTHYEIIVECKLVLEGVSISHVVCLGKTSNSQYENSWFFLRPKILLYTQDSQWVKNSIFHNGEYIFPNSLLNS